MLMTRQRLIYCPSLFGFARLNRRVCFQFWMSTKPRQVVAASLHVKSLFYYSVHAKNRIERIDFKRIVISVRDLLSLIIPQCF